MPLKPEEIAKIFDEENSIEISVQNSIEKLNKIDSKQKYKEIILFLKNLKKNTDVVDINDDFLVEYMTSNNFSYCNNIPQIVANIMTVYKFNKTFSDEALDHYSLDKIEKFISENKTLIEEYDKFILSIPLYISLSTMNSEENNALANEWAKDNISEDKNIKAPYIFGHNILNLCIVDNFLSTYLLPEDIENQFITNYYSEFYSLKFSREEFITYISKTSFAITYLSSVYLLLEKQTEELHI